MKKQAKKILALILSLALIMSTVVMNFSVAAVSLEEGESFDKAQGEYVFSWNSVSGFDSSFNSAKIDSDGTVTTAKPSEQWSTDASPNSAVSWEYQNRYMKPMGNGSTYLMTLKDTKVTNFRASIYFLNAWKEYGLVFGQSTPTDIDYTNGAVQVRMQGNAGNVIATGVDSASAKYVDSSINAEFYRSGNKAYDKVTLDPAFDTTVRTDSKKNLHTLNIEVIDGVLKLWWDDYEK